MRLILIAACLALAGCAAPLTTGAGIAASTADAVGVAPPAALADQTTLDEQGMLAAELAYKAARIAVETGVDAGLIKGETASRIAALDSTAYAALGAARSAYRAGNAASYKNALREAQAAISGLLALAGKGA